MVTGEVDAHTWSTQGDRYRSSTLQAEPRQARGSCTVSPRPRQGRPERARTVFALPELGSWAAPPPFLKPHPGSAPAALGPCPHNSPITSQPQPLGHRWQSLPPAREMEKPATGLAVAVLAHPSSPHQSSPALWEDSGQQTAPCGPCPLQWGQHTGQKGEGRGWGGGARVESQGNQGGAGEWLGTSIHPVRVCRRVNVYLKPNNRCK